jgi:hypothetical protein
MNLTRRSFIKNAGIGGAALITSSRTMDYGSPPLTAEILNPFNRAPVSLIIDDSTCLVNMAHFGIPQFAEVFPDQYKQDWRKLPREIPDSFVREFGEWSRDNGIKGKYSIVPYPACTGWINRFIPGWTKRELEDSISLVRDLMMPDWDIHPEMVSHTRVIDLKTGKPYPFPTPEYMENWEWSQTKSADELAAYQAYALTILKEAGLTCEGLTTPGGYGGRNMENLAMSTLQSVRDVFDSGVPHFFRDLYTEKGKSVKPLVLYPSDLDSRDPKCVVSIIGCTEDWFGGWDGLTPGNPDNFITGDLLTGRMVDVIESGEPAIIVCHWPGIYFNGEKTGFKILKEVVNRLNRKYNNLLWMKLGEIARYWAARELASIKIENNRIILNAPFSTPGLTLRLNRRIKETGIRYGEGELMPLPRVNNTMEIKSDNWFSDRSETLVCFTLKQGINELSFSV